MKTVLVTGDEHITDVDMIMNNLEYLFRTKALPEQFKVISTNAPGVEQVICPILRDAGFGVTEYQELPEQIDIIVVFTSLDDVSSRAYQIMNKQWSDRKPVYPFHVGKK